MRRLPITLAALVAVSIAFSAPAEAARRHYQPTAQVGQLVPNNDGKWTFVQSTELLYKAPRAAKAVASHRAVTSPVLRQAVEAPKASPDPRQSQSVFLPHPPGCPARQFCACGAAYRIFGRAIRELWPVSVWYKFQRTSPSSGMVAIPHRHHLFVLEYQVSGSNWMTSDFNSGGHQSRRQIHNIAGMTIVDPRVYATASTSYHAKIRHHGKRIRYAARRQ